MIDDYERVGIVARTAHTTIWKGFDPALHRSVALKQVRGEHAVAAVHREAAALAKLRHPNIVAVHDLFDDADSVWLVEQWITGAPLSAVLRHTGRLRAIDALALLHGALTGLSHAHQHNLVHGDITPTNILIDQTGTPMLVDFGLAITPGQPSLGATPGYAAPEAAAGTTTDKRSDVYSSCVVFTELLTGTRLFPQSNTLAAAHAQAGTTPTLNGIEEPVAAVLHTGLDPHPEARQADATVLLNELETALEESRGRGWIAAASLGAIGSTAATIHTGIKLTSTETSTASGATTPVGTPRQNRRTLVTAGALTAALIAAIATLFVLFVLRPDPPKQTVTAATPPTATANAAPAAGPLFSGRYKTDKGPELGTVTSDCPGCDVTLTSPGGSGQLRWNGVSWEGPIDTRYCGPYILTATPTVVVDGIAQELTYRSAPSPCTRETTGTLIRTGA